MYLVDAPLTANEVLRAYHHDEPLLFLGSAFITVAIVAAAFCAIRRRFDPLLVHLALFAYIYGQRLRLDSEIIGIVTSHNQFFLHLRAAIDYLVPIPAFAFLEAAGFLGRRGKQIVIVLSVLFLGLVIGALIFGPLHSLYAVNNSLVIVTLLAIMVQSLRQGSGNRDFVVMRIGLLCFIAGALWDNIVGYYIPMKVEPYGFAAFLATLGYVAAHRLLRHDQELVEMRSELELAQRIQLSILPSAFPESANFRAAARYVPMTSVAGDFYDFLNVSATQAGILIADVSGHGVPAALIASMVKMAATSQRANAANPASLLTGMNTALCGNTQDQSVTAAYVYLDAQAREFRYAAAGHPPMLLLRNGRVTEVIENGLILAISEEATFTQLIQPLEPGDRLILYTDGILEARDAQGKFFGEENTHITARQTATLSPAEAVNQIIASVQGWSKSQDDDLTVIVCDYLSTS